MSDLFVISRADIFAVYPKILGNILQAEEFKRSKDGALCSDFISLPTDGDYQGKAGVFSINNSKFENELAKFIVANCCISPLRTCILSLVGCTEVY